jgi:hypothetical protein
MANHSEAKAAELRLYYKREARLRERTSSVRAEYEGGRISLSELIDSLTESNRTQYF